MLSIFVIASALTLIILGCRKQESLSNPKNSQASKLTWKKSAKVAQRGIYESSGEEDAGGGGIDLCAGHGGTIGVGKSWNIATCKSDCSSGIGFRCGGDSYIKCSDGLHIPTGTTGVKCKQTTILTERQMTASLDFYEGMWLKINFENPLPEAEAENNIFEI